MAQAAKKKSKLIKRLIQFSVLALIVGGIAWWLIPNPIPVKIDEVRFGSFSATIEAKGYTRARDTLVIWAPVPGSLQRTSLQIGDPVVVKQVVARLVPDSHALRDPQTPAYLKARILAATAAKTRALADREQTAAVVNQARDNLRTAESLIATDNSGKAALQREQAQVAMRLIFNEIESMDAAAFVAGLDITAAEDALQRLQNDAAGEWEFRAPISGIILARAESGKPLEMGSALLEIGNPSDLEVIVETDASAASQVAAGQRVELRPEHGELLAGRVRRVELVPSDPVSADVSVPGKTRIAIEFAAPPAKWKNLGNRRPMHAQITIATIDNILKVSSKALVLDNGKPTVFVVENGRARKRQITRGVADADAMVIEGGLKEGDRVILTPGPNIHDGIRVVFN